MYFILEDVHNSFYTEAIANDQFSSLQAAEKKLQALKELKPKGKYFIVTRVQAWQLQGPGIKWDLEMEEKMEVKQLKRIADAIEEILRLVKKDMEPRTKKN